jgi:acyl-CoA reductase-like NAD-dependent aldehyde dehydrogenase
MSTTRIIVHKAIADAFAETFKAVTDQIFGAAPAMSLVNSAGVMKTKSLVQDAVDKGAKLIYGDLKAQLESQTQLGPMVLEGLTPDMRLYHEESFGPEVALFVVESDEEAARIANDSDYGLAAAVFTEDLRRGLSMSRLIESGYVTCSMSHGIDV